MMEITWPWKKEFYLFIFYFFICGNYRSTVISINNPDVVLSLVLNTKEIQVDVDIIFDRVKNQPSFLSSIN